MLGTLKDLALQLQEGGTTSLDLTKACLKAIHASEQADRIFLAICDHPHLGKSVV